MFKYFLFKLAAVIIPALPRGLAYRLAVWIALAAFYLPSKIRKNLEDNLRRVLGKNLDPREVTKAAKQAFKTQALNYVDLFRIPHVSASFFQQNVKLVGENYFHLASQRGNGVILASVHLGNVDLLMQMATTTGSKALVIIEPIRPPKLLKLVTKLRSSQGISFLPPGTSALRAAVRTLKKGGVVAIACDRDIQGRGMIVPFFGEPARLPSGAAELAMKTGAALLPVFGTRWPDGTYTITLEPPIEVVQGGEGAVEKNMERLVAVLEKHIALHPEQWLAFHTIWSDEYNDRPPTPKVALTGRGKR